MRFRYIPLFCILGLTSAISLFGQTNPNCFLEDFQPKNAVIPPYEDADQTSLAPTMTVTIFPSDTLAKVSKYIFGNAIASWLGSSIYNSVLIGHLQKLSPTLIRYPGGSWADIFFWNGDPGDLPNTIPDGGNNGQPISLYPQYGMNSWPTSVDTYYDMRWDVDTEGLITINYGYARYGLSEKPVERAAHLAAEWVRYDDGRTKFWEIGNENGGPWEAGWQIDTTRNRDGQPEIITGELYGRHFKIFADSMRTAAEALGNTIYIGGQILHVDGTGSWNAADREWNEGFFREAGDAADFYVIHNYFGNSNNARYLLNLGTTLIRDMIDFINQDIVNKSASVKPIALTEWNMSGIDLAKTSVVNGMQSVIIFCEMIKRGYGMSSRWLVANWESDGMFYKGDDSSIPAWSPRPDFFYAYYLQRFFGDHAIKISSSLSDVVAYASIFRSGELGVVIVNKGLTERVVRLSPGDRGIGEKYYVYSLTGGNDNGEFSQYVYVNDVGPTGAYWGPIEDLEDIPARAYPITNEIKLLSPGRSVQFILIESGENVVSIDDKSRSLVIDEFSLSQNHPNPFNPSTTISFTLPRSSIVTLKVFDIEGHEIGTLVQNEYKDAGRYHVVFNATNFPSGVYFYRLIINDLIETKKMLLLK